VSDVLTVHDVMTTSVVSVQETTPLKEVAQVLVDRGISGVPVVNESGRVAEIVRQRRLARFFGDSKSNQARRAKLEATTAAEAMTTPAITISPTQPVAEAARLMTARQVNRLVVLDAEELIGIVTRADLVRAFVRSDEDLVEVIRKEVLLGILWVDPAGFTVEVRRGVATITGHTERRSTAEAIRSTVVMVPGIVAVNADISWSLDDADIRPVTLDAFFPYSPK
jgi:CBS domain-containing protein